MKIRKLQLIWLGSVASATIFIYFLYSEALLSLAELAFLLAEAILAGIIGLGVYAFKPSIERKPPEPSELVTVTGKQIALSAFSLATIVFASTMLYLVLDILATVPLSILNAIPVIVVSLSAISVIGIYLLYMGTSVLFSILKHKAPLSSSANEDLQSTGYAEIKDKLELYYPSQHVIFRTKFIGKLAHGFFSNQIFPPEGTIFSEGYDRISLWAPDTLVDGFPNTKGELDGNVNKVSEWSWIVPENAPEGQYRVHMRIHNHFGIDNRPAVYERIDTFTVKRYHAESKS